MNRIKLKIKHNPSLDYYLLQPRKVSNEGAKSLVEEFTGETEFTLINEHGITFTDCGYVIIGKDPKTSEVKSTLHIENENDFEIIE